VSANGLALAGSAGWEKYAQHLEDTPPLEMGIGPSGSRRRRPAAVHRGRVPGEICAPWRGLAVRQHYRAMLCVPLWQDDHVIGVLNAYRAAPGEWTRRDRPRLAAGRPRRHRHPHGQPARGRAPAGRRPVPDGALAARQSHEHANRLHAIYGLLALVRSTRRGG
jgi:hypothetical protein